MAKNTSRETGRMQDIDGVPVVFGINQDGTVRIEVSAYLSLPGRGGTADLDHAGREEFSRLYFEAVRQADEEDAGENAERVRHA